jgi:serine/threonine protein phosphatase 1
MRTFVIGDIHGALKALEQVVNLAPIQKNDRLIFLGDYVDGWSQSAGVIQYLIELSYRQPCIFIRGNHDTWCETWLQNNSTPAEWEFHGGKSTMESYLPYEAADKQTHIEFFNRMKDYFVDENNRLYVHAGFTSMHGPAKEHHSSNYSWDRTLWEMAIAMDQALHPTSPLYPKRLQHFSEIYIGHTPVIDYGYTTPVNAGNLWNIDTGAAFTGPLTLMDVESKQYWQSEVVQILYPDEKGRNK